MLYFRMILTMLVNLYTSRIVLNTLGVEDFGIYTVVGGVVAMFGFLNGAMSSATQRFLSFELGRGDLVQLRRTFNATLIIHIGIAVLLLVLAESLGLWFVKNYLVLPASRMQAALWVYHFSVLSFVVAIVQLPYHAVIIARERMNVYAYVSILEVSLKLLVVFMLTWMAFDKLSLYGVLIFAVTLLIAAIYILYSRYHFGETKFEVVKDKKLYTTLISYSGWNMFGNIAAVAKIQGVSIILNLFFGPVVNAARGIAIQVQNAVQAFVLNFQMAVNPQIIKSYAAGHRAYMTELIIRSSKFSFYLLFMLSLPIVLEVDQLLKLWLKTVPDYSAIFTVLILAVILIDSVSGPLMTAIQASGKIKVYQVVVGSLLLLILPLSYLFLKAGYSPEITLYINIVISILALAVRLFIVGKLLDFPVWGFIHEVVLRNTAIVVLSLSLPLFLRSQMDANYLRLLLVAAVAPIWSGLLIYLIGLRKSEKELLGRAVKKVFRRK